MFYNLDIIKELISAQKSSPTAPGRPLASSPPPTRWPAYKTDATPLSACLSNRYWVCRDLYHRDWNTIAPGKGLDTRIKPQAIAEHGYKTRGMLGVGNGGATYRNDIKELSQNNYRSGDADKERHLQPAEYPSFNFSLFGTDREKERKKWSLLEIVIHFIFIS